MPPRTARFGNQGRFHSSGKIGLHRAAPRSPPTRRLKPTSSSQPSPTSCAPASIRHPQSLTEAGPPPSPSRRPGALPHGVCPLRQDAYMPLRYGAGLPSGARAVSSRRTFPLTTDAHISKAVCPSHFCWRVCWRKSTLYFFSLFSAQKTHVKSLNHLTRSSSTTSAWHVSYL